MHTLFKPFQLHAHPISASQFHYRNNTTWPVQWKQNNWELRKRHSKRRKKMERLRGECDCQQSVWACIVWLKTFTTHSCPPLRYFCSLNLTVSHRIIQGNDCFLPLCDIVFRSPPASHVSSSNGQWSSQLFCVYCINSGSWLYNKQPKQPTYFVRLTYKYLSALRFQRVILKERKQWANWTSGFQMQNHL
jgi:hypothetical protein